MTRQEFESRTSRPVSDSDYKKIEFVYTYHPSISDTKGKDEIAQLFNMFGMRIIMDMIPTAEKAKELEDKIMATKSQLARLTEEYQQLKNAE